MARDIYHTLGRFLQSCQSYFKCFCGFDVYPIHYQISLYDCVGVMRSVGYIFTAVGPKGLEEGQRVLVLKEVCVSHY